MKIFVGVISLLISSFLIVFTGGAYLIEVSPWHSADYFGLVFMIFSGLPGVILVTLGILSLKPKRVLFTISGNIFLLIFVISLPGIFTAAPYMRGEIIGFGICWLLVGLGYRLLARF